MATKPGLGIELDPASSDEDQAEPASDFDVAADALADELGASPTPTFRRALKEAIHACMGTDYAEEQKEPGTKGGKGEGLALIFGAPKGK